MNPQQQTPTPCFFERCFIKGPSCLYSLDFMFSLWGESILSRITVLVGVSVVTVIQGSWKNQITWFSKEAKTQVWLVFGWVLVPKLKQVQVRKSTEWMKKNMFGWMDFQGMYIYIITFYWIYNLGGGFKHVKVSGTRSSPDTPYKWDKWFQTCFFSTLLGGMIQSDLYFSDGLKPPPSNRYILWTYMCRCLKSVVFSRCSD